MINANRLTPLEKTLSILLILVGVLCNNVLAQVQIPIYTFISGGGATGSVYPTTTIPTYFGSIGQSMVLPRNVKFDDGGGVMVAADLMFVGGTGDITSPQVTFNDSPGPIVKLGTLTTVSVTMTDDDLAAERMYYRPILGGNFTQVDLASAGSNVFTGILPVDSMGVEFYFKAFDSQNLTVSPSTGHYYAYTLYTTPEIPLHTGNAVKDYRIVAEPFVSANVTTLFSNLPGEASDTSNYRLWQYSNKTWTAFNDFKTMDRGKGYFLIVASAEAGKINLKMDNQTSPANNRSSLFTLPLISDDWNLIGNPYPVEINWDSVMALNGNPAGVSGTLKIYQSNSGTYSNASSLGAFQGAFVKVTGTAPSNFQIGLGHQSIPGGRISKRVSSNLASAQWEIPLVVQQGASENLLAGIGMRPDASQGLDRFDDFSPPHFFDYVEMISQRPELKVNDLTKDIVNSQEKYIWKFESMASSKENIEMSWDNTTFGNNSIPLYLYDVGKNEVVDMRENNSIKFSPAVSQQFKIYYGIDIKDIAPDALIMNLPFPNPFRESTEFRFALPGVNDSYRVELELFNSLGQRMRTLARGTYTSGRHSLTWNGQGDDSEKVASGLYFYKMVVDGKESRVFDGRLIFTR